MNDFLSVVRNSRLFSGVSEEELTAMLSCLGARQTDFPKDSFLLRAGGSVDSIGLILSGTVMILQEDIWGNRNILSKLGPGQTYAVSFACVPGSAINVSVFAQTEVTVLTMNVGRILHHVPLQLQPSQPCSAKSIGGFGRKKPPLKRKADPYGSAYNTGKAHVLPLGRGTAPQQPGIRHSLHPAAIGRFSGRGTQRPIPGAWKNAG